MRRDLAPAVRELMSRAVLGPCPCHDCGKPLNWNGEEWRETDGRRHDCPARCSKRLCACRRERAA